MTTPTSEQGATTVVEQSAPSPAPPASSNGKALAPTTTAAPRAPTLRLDVEPQTIDEAWRLAQYIASSELVPKAYRDRPQDIIIAIKKGKEVGLPAMAAIHNIVVMNGRPELWGDGLLGVIVASPFYKDHDEYYLVAGQRRELLLAPDLVKDDTTAVTTFWRSDNPRPKTATFSIANAKKAGLWTKAGPWQTNPDRMLRYRARGFAASDCFADVLTGVARPGWGSPGAPPPVLFDAPLETTSPAPEVRRMSETATDQSPTATPVNAKPAAPPLEEITIGPVTVKEVEQFLGGYTATLSSGQQVDTIDVADALDLEKLKGTKHTITAVCVKNADGHLELKSFTAAD